MLKGNSLKLYIKCMSIVPICTLEQKSILHQMFHCFSSPNGHSLKPKKRDVVPDIASQHGACEALLLSIAC